MAIQSELMNTYLYRFSVRMFQRYNQGGDVLPDDINLCLFVWGISEKVPSLADSLRSMSFMWIPFLS